jgi:hypothetical protein
MMAMKNRTPRRRAPLALAFAAAAISFVSLPALGQAPPGTGAPAPLAPPTPGRPDKPPAAWNYITMILIAGMVIGASLIPSKRGHQD